MLTSQEAREPQRDGSELEFLGCPFVPSCCCPDLQGEKSWSSCNPQGHHTPFLQPGKFPEPKAELQQSDTVKKILSPEAAELPAWCWVCSPAAGWSQPLGASLKMLQVFTPFILEQLLLLWRLTKEEELLEARTGMMGNSQFHPLLRVKSTVNAMHP